MKNLSERQQSINESRIQYYLEDNFLGDINSICLDYTNNFEEHWIIENQGKLITIKFDLGNDGKTVKLRTMKVLSVA